MTYLADAGLYLALGLAANGERHDLSLRDQNAIRAGFAVGGSFLVLGLMWWAVTLWRDRQPRRREMFDPTPFSEEGSAP